MKRMFLFLVILSLMSLAGCKVQVENNDFAGEVAPQTGIVTQPEDLLSTIEATNRFQSFVTGLSNTRLDELLQGPGPYTVLVPTQEAWNTFPQYLQTDLFLPQNSAQLRPIMVNHIIAGRLSASDIATRDTVLTIAGKTLPVRRSGTDLFIGSAKIVEPDIPATNGMIQVVNYVLVPPPAAP